MPRPGELRWMRPSNDGPIWHLGFTYSEALCGARWPSEKLLGADLAQGVPERHCIECQDEIARLTGVTRT